MNSMKRVGLVGAGLMGKGIGKTLIEKGFQLSVVVHKNRTHADELIKRGAIECKTIPELTKTADIVVTCLPSLDSIREVFKGDQGLIANMKRGGLIIDTSTSDPQMTKNLESEAYSNSLLMVDAPLLGGPKMTWEGSISLVVGGRPDSIKIAKPILDAFSIGQFFAGGPGAGHTVKLINNAVTLTNSAILYETFTLAEKLGVDLETLYKVLDTSMASSKRLHVIAPALINNDHTKAFALETATKDLKLYSQLTNSSEVLSLVGDGAKTQYMLACSLGYGQEKCNPYCHSTCQSCGNAF